MLAVHKAMARPHGFDQKELRSFCFRAGGSPRRGVATTPRTPTRKVALEHSISFKNWEQQPQIVGAMDSPTRRSLYDHMASTPKSELDAAAVKVQKTYKSYRTRRNMADCAVVTEELWWKEQTEQSISITWSNLLDTTLLELRSIHFFNEKKNETAVSRWGRAKRRLAKVGKGLSKDEKARQLALQHWLEAIDPRHRYGHNLHIYYQVWLESESVEPFFYWLDVGAGREVNLDKCHRSKLLKQCIKYLGTEERKAYEVVVKDGKLVYKQTDMLVETDESSKWIFVLSTTRNLYIGKKQKGTFQHSSFLSGAATSAAGRLVAKAGVLKAMWPYSGHYLPTEENFKVFISFLLQNKVDLTDVKKCSLDDDPYPTYENENENENKNSERTKAVVELPAADATKPDNGSSVRRPVTMELQKRTSWSNGTAARISCVNNYPVEIQAKALEYVTTPRASTSPAPKFPLPSPRPSPRQLMSPGLSVISIPSPRVISTSCTPRRR